MTIDHVSAAESVARLLTKLILSGELTPGSRLLENEVASSFGVSRNTVREAFRVLKRDGLAQQVHHRSVVVRELTRADIDDIHRVRELLEMAAINALPADQDAVRSLESSVARLRLAAEAGDLTGIAEADLDFHRELVGLLRSPRINALFDTIALEVLLCLSIIDRGEVRDRPALLVSDHEELLELVKRGDRKRLRSALTVHLDGGKELLLQALETGSTSDA